MSRSGYVDDLDILEMGRWRGQVSSSIRGNRGQLLIKDMVVALDKMPVKELIAEDLELDGQVCALGAVAKLRGIDISQIDPEDPDSVAEAFNISTQLAKEIAYENDDTVTSPQLRWTYMHDWAIRHTIKPKLTEAK